MQEDMGSIWSNESKLLHSPDFSCHILTRGSLLVEIINCDQGSGRLGLYCSAFRELIINKWHILEP